MLRYASCKLRFTLVFHVLPRCGFEGESEIVCCPAEETTKISDRGKPLRPADLACKNLVESVRAPEVDYILGGVVAEEGEFPHMVALGYQRSSAYVFLCGGSLISQKFVLTAVHCIETLERIKPKMIRVGVLNITGSKWNDETDYEIEGFHLYPNYTRARKYHDLAIIRLTKPVPYSNKIFPACLYTKEREPTTPLYVTGWGVTDITRASTSKVLLKALLDIVQRDRCNMLYTKTRRLPDGITDGQICAGHATGLKDTCQGDSGGPLQGQTALDGHYRIVGITSFGNGCGSLVPGVYTRVFKYLDWIESIVWPSE
ncbi:serine protease persephone-like isoform X2 [Battus philenor]|uniref:serine protease persephone-like isoform X2 n=1 Tax=Battus philenor TaxID=42288 RepID=UPI0035CF494A